MDKEMTQAAKINIALALPLDDLYSQLIPDMESHQLYGSGGRVQRGKEIFEHLLQKFRTRICEEYRQRTVAVKDSVDLVALAITALSGKLPPEVPLIPFAVLLLKIGFDEICPKSKS